jgi:hypothetical protein
MSEVGLDLHEWETRWQELQDAIADDPEQALPEVVSFVGEMLAEAGFDLDEVTAEGDDPDIRRDYIAARELATLVEQGNAEREDVDAALEDLHEIYEYIAGDRAT